MTLHFFKPLSRSFSLYKYLKCLWRNLEIQEPTLNSFKQNLHHTETLSWFDLMFFPVPGSSDPNANDNREIFTMIKAQHSCTAMVFPLELEQYCALSYLHLYLIFPPYSAEVVWKNLINLKHASAKIQQAKFVHFNQKWVTKPLNYTSCCDGQKPNYSLHCIHILSAGQYFILIILKDW